MEENRLCPLDEDGVLAFQNAVSSMGVTLMEAAERIGAAFAKMAERIEPIVVTAAEMTPRERHLLKHAKKYRVRKKYKNRLWKRVLTLEAQNNASRS
jgi:hypothetical protein